MSIELAVLIGIDLILIADQLYIKLFDFFMDAVGSKTRLDPSVLAKLKLSVCGDPSQTQPMDAGMDM